MITSVHFRRAFRCFAAGETFTFTPGVNLVVGDQGCGKSTLIELIRSCGASRRVRDAQWRAIAINERDAKATIDVTTSGGVRLAGYDFERDSGRMSAEFQYDIMQQIDAMRSSHGEASLRYLRGVLAAAQMPGEASLRYLRGVLAAAQMPGLPLAALLDEPDANLSVRSCYELVRIFRAIAHHRGQVIAAVHNPIVIAGTIPGDATLDWGAVLSLEHRGWIDPAEFLASQAAPAVPRGATR